MWTSIRSRTGTALTVVAVLLTVILAIAAILFAVSRVFPPQTHSYQSYDLDVTPFAPWHPGQSLSLHWAPFVGGYAPSEPPSSVMCQFALYGPFPTLAAAQGPSPVPIDAAPAASAPPLALSSTLGAPAPPAEAYVLPAALAPGYYTAVGSAVLDPGGGGSISWAVEVAA